MATMEPKHRLWYERGVSLAKFWRDIRASAKRLGRKRTDPPKLREPHTLRG